MRYGVDSNIGVPSLGKKQLSSKKRGANPTADRSSESKSQVSKEIAQPQSTTASESSLLFSLAVGAGLSATMLMPADSVSGPLGFGLPLVAYWLLVPFLLTWLVAQKAFLRQGSDTAILQRTAVVATYAWAPVLIWVLTVVIVRWDQGNNRTSLNMLWQYIGAAFCTVVLTVYASNSQRRRSLLQLFLFLCFGLAVHGLHQYFVSMPADRRAFELDPVAVMRMAGIEAQVGSQEYQQFRNRVNSTEPFATFALANSLAVVLSVATVLGFGLAIGEWLKKRTLRSIIPWLLMTLVIGVVLILTKSRAAWIGGAIGMAGLIAALIWSRRDLRPAMLWVSGIGLLGLMVIGWIGYRQDPLVVLEATKSFQYRIEYWIATGHMIADFLLTGVGPGQFQSHYTWYKLPEASETVADPHNWIMEVLATTGVGGLLAWCLFVGIIWRWRAKVAKFVGLAANAPSDSSDAGRRTGIWDEPGTSGPQLGLMVGAFLGIVLAFGAGILVGILPDLEALFWSMLGASGMGAWVLYEQRQTGNVTPPAASAQQGDAQQGGALPGDAPAGECVSVSIQKSVLFWPMVVWGVALLAAGGWMVAGVCLPLWIFIAIWIGSIGESLRSQQQADFPVQRTRWIGMQIGKVAIFAFFLWSTWNPVMNLLSILGSMNFGPRVDVTTLQKAISIDPQDPRPWQFWARYWLDKGLDGTTTDRQKALVAIEKWLERDPASATMQRNAGDWVWMLAAVDKLKGAGGVDEDLLNLATRYYREAEQRYPNDASMVLQLAAIQEAAGAHESAVGLAERAVQLDQSHSHGDRKLQIQRIWWPGFTSTDSTIGVQAVGDFLVPAPDVLQRILSSSR